jgi:hypothetical protein
LRSTAQGFQAAAHVLAGDDLLAGDHLRFGDRLRDRIEL